MFLDELRASDDCEPAPRDVEDFDARERSVGCLDVLRDPPAGVALPFPFRVVSVGGGMSFMSSLSLGSLSSTASRSKYMSSSCSWRNTSPMIKRNY